MSHEPIKCVECGRFNIEKNIIIENSGIDTFLCINCETLMTMTDHTEDELALKASKGNKVTIRYKTG